MMFLTFVSFDAQRILNFHEDLRIFISLHDLDIEWERDISILLQRLSGDQISELISNKQIVQQFENTRIPALLVQEPNFHTIDVPRSKAQAPEIFVLQPMHQVIYNRKRWSMAIPAKQQSHGRAAGNDMRVGLKL